MDMVVIVASGLGVSVGTLAPVDDAQIVVLHITKESSVG